MRILLFTVFFSCVIGIAQAGPPAGVGRVAGPSMPSAPRSLPSSHGFTNQRGSSFVPTGTGRPLTGGASGINPGVYRSSGGYGGSYRSGYRDRNEQYRYSRVPGNWWLTPYYYPYVGGYLDAGWNDSDFYGQGAPALPQYGQDPAIADLGAGQNELGGQVQRLAEEVQRLRTRQLPPEDPQTSVALAPQPPVPPVTLVLRDGLQLQVENYAVMGKTFWDFSAQPVRKIPISNIDVDASIKLTEARGGEFPSLQVTP